MLFRVVYRGLWKVVLVIVKYFLLYNKRLKREICTVELEDPCHALANPRRIHLFYAFGAAFYVFPQLDRIIPIYRETRK